MDMHPAPLLTSTQKDTLLASLRASGLLEVVPVGQPVSGVRHAASVAVAAGITLRESGGEANGERTGR